MRKITYKEMVETINRNNGEAMCVCDFKFFGGTFRMVTTSENVEFEDSDNLHRIWFLDDYSDETELDLGIVINERETVILADEEEDLITFIIKYVGVTGIVMTNEINLIIEKSN